MIATTLEVVIEVTGVVKKSLAALTTFATTNEALAAALPVRVIDVLEPTTDTV
jgi:hypothetical protein